MWQLLSYGPVTEPDANVAQIEITQKIKRITDLGNRFGITADVLAFTFRFRASTTTDIALPVGADFFAPVRLTLSEVKDCSSFIPSVAEDTYLLLTECLDKHSSSTVDMVGHTNYPILELLGRENIIVNFYPDSLSIMVIFSIFYLFCSTFLIIFFRIWKSVRETVFQEET